MTTLSGKTFPSNMQRYGDQVISPGGYIADSHLVLTGTALEIQGYVDAISGSVHRAGLPVAHELVERAFVLEDRVDHDLEVVVEHLDELPQACVAPADRAMAPPPAATSNLREVTPDIVWHAHRSRAARCSARPTASRPYERHRPETTVLHLVVREHLETFLAMVREERGKDLPRYVEQELRRYLRCGILAHGFCRFVCPDCQQELVVAYSCKCRGACPSCSARRMCDAAATLVDHVLPDVPVQQWVRTVPHEVQRLLALRPDALTAQSRIFVEEVARWQKRDGGETGSVTFVQRFNATLGAFVHLHVVVLDGVFVRHAETKELVFQEGRAPSREEIAVIAARVEKRMTRWLRRRDLVDERPAEDRSNEAPSPDPLEACMQMSLFGGTFLRLDKDGTPVPLDDERFQTRGKSPWSAEVTASTFTRA